MGLDMYLNARKFIWRDNEQPVVDGHKIKQVATEAIYWRKANAIHQWFVDNVQEGTDDCGKYDVSRDHLKVLRSICRAVLEDRTRAPKLLPTQSGFFFGSTDYDEGYFQDVEDTLRSITRVLAEFEPDEWDFEYHSSW